MKKLKIGITSDYIDTQLTGIGIYTKHLIENLLTNNDLEIYLIHYNKSCTELYDMANEILVDKIPIPPAKMLTNVIKLPIILKNVNLDLIHITAPNPSDNLGYLKLNNIHKILTIHDLYMLMFPIGRGALRSFDNLKIYSLEKLWVYTLKKLIPKVDYIISDSDNTKKDIIRFLKIPEEKIKVIHLAYNDMIFKPSKQKIKDSIILSADSDPIIIETYYRLRKKGIRDKLIMFGINESYKKQLEKLLIRYNLEKDVIILDYISNEELLKLYNTSQLFIFIHSYEGFGIPLLEAMACGCPVVSSNVASIPEVIGDAGILVNPNNSDEQSNVIYEILVNDALRQDLIRKGLERVKTFSWKRTAKETYNLYKEVLDGRYIH